VERIGNRVDWDGEHTFVAVVLLSAGALGGVRGAGRGVAAGVHCLLGHSLELVHFLGVGVCGGKRLLVRGWLMMTRVAGLEVGRIEE
jgi:hypothetical protein